MLKAVIFSMLLIQSLLVTGCFDSAAQQNKQLSTTKGDTRGLWQAATYRGLTMGKSTPAEMRRALGRPKRTEVFDGPNPEIWYEYEGTWEFSGTLTVVVDKKKHIIRTVHMYPRDLNKEEATNYFGSDYVTTRYDFDLCLGDEEAAPLFESQSGSVISIEYRQRGIAVAVNALGRVDHISYVSEPIGAGSSKCK